MMKVNECFQEHSKWKTFDDHKQLNGDHGKENIRMPNVFLSKKKRKKECLMFNHLDHEECKFHQRQKHIEKLKGSNRMLIKLLYH